MPTFRSSFSADVNNIAWLNRIIALGAIANFILTNQLWLSSRYFPLSPVVEWIPALASPYDQFLVYVLLSLLAAIAIFPLVRTLQVSALLIMSFLALQDQSRWHPWFCWYFFLMLHCTIYNFLDSTSALRLSLVNSMRLIICCSYFWGAVQKIGVIFFASVFPWFVSALLPDGLNGPWLQLLAISVPICECAIAIGLLLPEWRRLALWLLVALHAFILLCIGPLGHNVNSNIWPWNITMMGIAWLLFSKERDCTPAQILLPKSALHAIMLILFGLAPILSFFDSWDSYPAFALYSGSQKAAVLEIPLNAQAKLPEQIRSLLDETGRLKLSSWAMAELNTPDYAESRIYRNALSFLCDKTEDLSIKLKIFSKPERLSGKRSEEETLDCGLVAKYPPNLNNS